MRGKSVSQSRVATVALISASEWLVPKSPSEQSLRGHVLVVVAHPDDEALGCGVLLQRINRSHLIFMTDGAPRDVQFWHTTHVSREQYATARREEARRALIEARLQRADFFETADQELYRELDAAYRKLAHIVEEAKPDALLTHAYEGGHPDHDACCFLVSRVAEKYGLPAWEMPLYHRARGERVRQRFINGGEASEVRIQATPEELDCKQRMLAAYDSQKSVLQEFEAATETFRPLAAYDFRQPPHAGMLNYEEWGWPMTGRELCREFEQFYDNERSIPQFIRGEAA